MGMLKRWLGKRIISVRKIISQTQQHLWISYCVQWYAILCPRNNSKRQSPSIWVCLQSTGKKMYFPWIIKSRVILKHNNDLSSLEHWGSCPIDSKFIDVNELWRMNRSWLGRVGVSWLVAGRVDIRGESTQEKRTAWVRHRGVGLGYTAICFRSSCDWGWERTQGKRNWREKQIIRGVCRRKLG